MESSSYNKLVEQLTAGFEALQEEYQKLFGQHQSLERKLATAREQTLQYNELAKLCDSGAVTTPPLSLSSSPGQQKRDHTEPSSIAGILCRRQSHDAAGKVSSAITAAQTLKRRPANNTSNGEGVKIWSGPAADTDKGSSMMPSISESPLEQDFTIEGKPSRLGCPFASMAGKKLSSHAASVLSRYNTKDSVNGNAISSTPLSSVSRVNGRESYSRRESRRASFVDPIKAEICGLSDHNKPVEEAEKPQEEAQESALQQHVEGPETAEVGVCPIRFLNQHSPEEVATYFEKHKHELPRSHEVCVRRYQSNEEQIKQLDAKYGNLVSMIQGLGAKHQDYLPEEPDPEDAEHETAVEDARSNEKVRKWASSVVADAGENCPTDDEAVEAEDEGRQQHFARPLRDIRVGESPSRPWGITVPAKYLEEVEERGRTPSEPAQVTSSPALPRSPAAAHHAAHVDADREDAQKTDVRPRPAGKCPFDFAAANMMAPPLPPALSPPLVEPSEPAVITEEARRDERSNKVTAPAFIAAADAAAAAARNEMDSGKGEGMVFTGPVFIGYSAEDAIKILRETGLGGR